MTKALLILLWPVGLIAIVAARCWPRGRHARRPCFRTWIRRRPMRRARLPAFPTRDVARFLLAILIGTVAVFGVIDLIGLIVVHAGPTIDKPIWHWTVNHHRWHVWKSFMGEATQLGYKWTTWGAAMTAAVILALVSPNRRWLPPLALGTLIIVEHFLTRAVVDIFHRPGPPGSGGTFPSGGTDRAVVFYGLIAYFLWRELSGTRRGAIVAGTVVAALGFNEAYSRFYLAVHWLTDILSGFIYGCLLLCVFVGAVRFAGRARRRPPRVPWVSPGRAESDTGGAEGRKRHVRNGGLIVRTHVASWWRPVALIAVVAAVGIVVEVVFVPHGGRSGAPAARATHPPASASIAPPTSQGASFPQWQGRFSDAGPAHSIPRSGASRRVRAAVRPDVIRGADHSGHVVRAQARAPTGPRTRVSPLGCKVPLGGGQLLRRYRQHALDHLGRDAGHLGHRGLL